MAELGSTKIYGNQTVTGDQNVLGDISVEGTVDGRDVAADGAKLDGIEANATGDQTAAEILALVKTVDGSGSGLDADTLRTMIPTAGNTGTTIVARDSSGNFSAGTITASLSGNASTATGFSGARTVTLTGDVTGSTTTWTGSGPLNIATTIAPNSVVLGTDTTGNYVAGATAGTGISITGTAGEGWSPTITNTAPNVTTNITTTHGTTSVTVNSSDGTNGTINAATTSLAGVMTSADKTKLDGIATNANNYTHPSTHPATMITTTDEFVYSNSSNVQDVLDDLDQALQGKQASGSYVTTTDNQALHDTDALRLSANQLYLYKGDGTYESVDLSLYLDDTNLARLVSGSLNASTGIATFTRDDASTFTVDFSALFDDTDTNDYVDSISFATGTGILTLGRTGALADLTVDLDGRYQLAGTYNTIIGIDADIDTSGATIIDNLYMTDGVITSHGTRTLTLADLGYTGETNATADQTPTEILTAIKTVDGSGSGLDADTVDGIQGSSLVTKVASTDNAIVRFNGTTGQVQNSRVVINDDGHVGIGTTTPTDTLDIIGRISLNDGGSSVYVGNFAGISDDVSDNRNVGIGHAALYSNTTGYNNTATGAYALNNNSGGYMNTATGAYALNNNSGGFQNTATGFHALYYNNNGYMNTAVGTYSLRESTNGLLNTAMGHSSLRSNTTGSHNTAMGYVSLRYNTTGSHNTAMGSDSLRGNTTGTNNVAIGYQAGNLVRAGSTNTNGTYNTFIGTETRANTVGDVNETVIGYGTIGNGSNTVTLGNSSVTEVHMGGNGAGIVLRSPNGTAYKITVQDDGTITTIAV